MFKESKLEVTVSQHSLTELPNQGGTELTAGQGQTQAAEGGNFPIREKGIAPIRREMGIGIISFFRQGLLANSIQLRF